MSTAPLPPVERVRPGVWSIPVPIPINPLRYVLVYAFETDRGIYLVDAGWNTDDAFDTLAAGLTTVGASVADVRGVMVTHIHPDHYGLAGRVREMSGAWVALHPADAALIPDRYEEPEKLLERVSALLRQWGAPPEEVEGLTYASMPVRKWVSLVKPDVLLEDGDKPDVPGWDLQAIWTPGHSPGHLCFWEPRNRLMLTGDHILPRITPNIGLHPQAGDDPLGSFFLSLEKLEPYDSDEVLPAHEHRFVGLPARLAELSEHHEHRFDEVLEAVRAGRNTAWEVAGCMKWSRSWDRIEGFMRRAASCGPFPGNPSTTRSSGTDAALYGVEILSDQTTCVPEAASGLVTSRKRPRWACADRRGTGDRQDASRRRTINLDRATAR